MDTLKGIPREILDPDPYLMPTIHMSPFSGRIKASGSSIEVSEIDILNEISLKLTNRILSGVVTLNGRSAISLALDAIVTSEDFTISILTNSGSGYVSGCVTSEIGKYCKYVIGDAPDADAYFLIHEFGRPVTVPKELLNTPKPIIEDCAYALVDPSFRGQYGSIGDYIIYSLPKAFDMQYGGLFFSSNEKSIVRKNNPSMYLLENLINNFKSLTYANKQRLNVYKKLQQTAKRYKLIEYYPYSGSGVPHAFMVALPGNIDFQEIKKYMNGRGVESSIFYGQNAYFIPCHQNINDWEIEYMIYHLHQSIINSARVYG
ncbi:putative DegT/DnrJ/EryC1/StrS aminotransferase [Vibrio nigripulchritudo MADA3029]|uniref:aminotransferase DegT n=1 Tax=Vibrio nigripulchritudo TaxID=28173 RepID=UPI0003B22301|nr:aminotransferase DegT [Vibrio nigripulchritudo]CCN47641.1 putative DegT/DnrJ/EryC1/StrS aminotransferase [Vibrio nigripulchritudo MADA3020]CCN56536.1 putative DegT/DnrJ/EryC1/StrS aminotransferase [Vibrio nigripulchritudo MADA3021]CCN58840.1 putative DegT/DnrJ/EryC1/StrS aminotransferase [Vibrio nigripulchritudo MADA3029]